MGIKKCLKKLKVRKMEEICDLRAAGIFKFGQKMKLLNHQVRWRLAIKRKNKIK